jgi:putative ABC transport system permease protein
VRFLKLLGRLYWWRLRTQPIQEALAIAGIAAGVALIFAVEIANTSVPASVRQLIHGITGPASVEVASRSPEGFDEGFVNRVGEAPGVFGASGALEVHVNVIGPHGELPLTLFGADPSLSAIGGTLPHRFHWRGLENAVPAPVQGLGLAKRLGAAHVDAIALPEGEARAIGASVGQLLVVGARGHAVVVVCGEVVSSRQIGVGAESPVAVALLPAAQRITGLAHRVSRVFVLPEHGKRALVTSSLRRELGDTLDVRSSNSELTLLEGATRASNEVSTLFAALSVVVGLLFAYNAMLLTLPARRRYVTRLRNMGAYRHELVALLSLEILVLGVVASVIGLVLGDLLARTVFGSVPRYLAAGFPIGTERLITPAALLIAVGGGVLATAIAAVGPAIGALRGRPLENAADTSRATPTRAWLSPRVRVGLGATAIVVAVAVTLLVPGSGLVAVGALAVALGLVLTPVVPWLVNRSNWVSTRLRSAVGFVATTELRAAPARATAVAATGAIAVFAIVALGGTLNDVRRGVSSEVEDFFGRATVVVSPSSFAQTAFPVQPFAPAPVVRRISHVKGVTRVEELRSSFLDVGKLRLLLIVKPQDDPVPVHSSQIIQGSAGTLARRIHEGGWIAMASTVAREWHLRVGGPVVLPTPSGSARFRLAATITNYGWPPGAVIMSPADYTRLWRSTGTTILYVDFSRGITEANAAHLVHAALIGTGLTASTRSEAAGGIFAALNQGMAEMNQISTLVLTAAVLAVIAAMSGSIWQRRPRLANLKRLGMYRSELVSTMFVETGIVVLIGCLIGAVFGLWAQPLATEYIRHSTGIPELFSPDAWLGVRTLALATILATLATALLGYFVTRRSVVWKSAA